jgi:hypothetical protein
MRQTVSSMSMGGVPQLGPGYTGGFALGGLLKGIGRVAGALVGLPPRAQGPNSPGAGAAPLGFLPRGLGAGGLRTPKPGQSIGGFLGLEDPDFGDVISGASSTAPRYRGFGGAGRRRRTNPLNLKALGRADRRLEAFAKIARRYVSPNAPQRVVRTKRRKR